MMYPIVITVFDAYGEPFGIVCGESADFPNDEQIEGLVLLVIGDGQYAHVTIHHPEDDSVLLAATYEVHNASS